ncbi:hypothetical protein BS50DRAFT_251230 [Corynespora cassiicola Philippines]|uniref:Uncharacterized protein n=1 Tax=Corynespora cassiicola Philippines TaxID=1448308 RepID=A0A2T2P514_CORCC|nr:hypothetical protein BS50DRAFT_251230 [Corynespora cassiicola Philippines]
MIMARIDYRKPQYLLTPIPEVALTGIRCLALGWPHRRQFPSVNFQTDLRNARNILWDQSAGPTRLLGSFASPKLSGYFLFYVAYGSCGWYDGKAARISWQTSPTSLRLRLARSTSSTTPHDPEDTSQLSAGGETRQVDNGVAAVGREVRQCQLRKSTQVLLDRAKQ